MYATRGEHRIRAGRRCDRGVVAGDAVETLVCLRDSMQLRIACEFLIVAALCVSQETTFLRPSALMAMEQARTGISRADINWTIAHPRETTGAQGKPMHYRTVIVDSRIAEFNNGTDDGVTAETEDGAPVRGQLLALYAPGQRWEFSERSLTGDLWEDNRPTNVADVRCVGLLPRPALVDGDPGETLWKYPKQQNVPRRYRQKQVGEVFEVDMLVPDESRIVRWIIDPRVGWNPTRCQAIEDGRVAAESVTEYGEFNGTWLPVACSYFNGKGELITCVEVQGAKINTPDIPEFLEPEFIGLEPGIHVSSRKHGAMTYAGQGRLVTHDEYRELVADGQIKTSQRLSEFVTRLEREYWERKAAEYAAGQTAAATPDVIPAGVTTSRPARPVTSAPTPATDDWERYTRDFIARYKLDEGQTNSAMRILRDCQQQRDHYLRVQKSRLEALEHKAAEGDESVRQKARDELARVRKPVDEIFEKRLKPALEKLPTRAQRQAVNEPAAETTPGKS
ncbi:MAG: hypothetical protein CHACPFDD_00641 [Phycisphaerae bacterium]|nr:hypothetical protein [Phycisphaerae bacterium]